MITQAWPLWVAHKTDGKAAVDPVIAWDFEPDDDDVSRKPVPITPNGRVADEDFRIVDNEAAMLRLRAEFDAAALEAEAREQEAAETPLVMPGPAPLPPIQQADDVPGLKRKHSR